MLRFLLGVFFIAFFRLPLPCEKKAGQNRVSNFAGIIRKCTTNGDPCKGMTDRSDAEERAVQYKGGSKRKRGIRGRISAAYAGFFLQILRIQGWAGPILQGNRGQKAGMFGHVFCGNVMVDGGSFLTLGHIHG